MIDATPDPRTPHGWGGLPCYLDEHDHLRVVRAPAWMTAETDQGAYMAILTGLGYHQPAANDSAFWPGPPDGGRAA